MKIKNLQITSPSVLDIELDVERPVCVLCGQHSALVLDLLRELIGDYGAVNDPDRFDDGHFIINSSLEIDGKDFDVCYIRNADFLGDDRIAANFTDGGLDFSEDDTLEFIDKRRERATDSSNILTTPTGDLSKQDDRPVFLYLAPDFNATALSSLFDSVAQSGRQLFVATDSEQRSLAHASAQVVGIE